LQFGQELLSTFSTQIGEVALIPATGGLFTVELVERSMVAQEHNLANHVIRRIYLRRHCRKDKMRRSKQYYYGTGKLKEDFLVGGFVVGVNAWTHH